MVSGYVSASLYREYGGIIYCVIVGKNWVKNVLITASLWPLTCSAIGLPVNSIASLYSSTRAVSLSTMVLSID